MSFASRNDDVRTPVGCCACVVGLALLLVALTVCGGVVVYFVSPDWLGVEQELIQEVARTRQEELQMKNAAWKDELELLRETLRKLESDKQELVEKLKESGVQSAGDLSADDPQARLLAIELVEVEKQLRAVTRKSEAYELAIEQMDSVLRRLQRQQMIADAGISDEELAELSMTAMGMDRDLQEALADEGGSAELEMDSVLNDVLQSPPDSSQGADPLP